LSIEFRKPERQVDLLSAIVESVFLALQAASLTSPDDAAKFLPRAYGHADKIITALKGKDENKPENLAWKWLTLTLAEATAQFLVLLRRQTILISGAKEKAVESFIAGSMVLSPDARFDIAALLSTSTHAVFAPARKALPHLIHSVTTLVIYDREKMLADFDNCLRVASAQVFASCHAEFEPLLATATGPAGGAARRDLAWARHGQWLQYRFQHEAVFSPDGKVKTPLSALYLRLRCYWHERIDLGTDADDRHDQPRWVAHLSDLHEALSEWLFSSCAEKIRIIAGGPGCGKSSFAKAFACEAFDDGKYRVIFVELQRLPFTGDLYSDIGKYLSHRHKPTGDEGSPGFPEHPFEWIKGDARPTLLVFDGLDELTHDQTAAAEISRKFVLNVKHLVSSLNSDGTAVRAVVLGRNMSCQEGLKEASLPITTMLNVAPIRELSKNDLRPHEFGSPSFRDEQTIYPELPDTLIADQRPEYWRRWTAAQGIPNAQQPEAITHEALSDLNVEPLLLHLLILSDYCNESWAEAAENRNLVYEDILQKVHGRNARRTNSSPVSELRDFMLLMECLGLAAWRGNARGGAEATYEAIREVHASRLKHKGGGHLKTDMRSLVLQTHARPLEGATPGFEFIHKSFGEYLAARGLMSLGLRSYERLTRPDDPASEEQIAEDWVKIVGDAEITPELLRFLKDEAALRCSKSDFQQVKVCLEALLSWVNRNGMPAHKVGAPTFRQLETLQRCAEASLLMVGTSVVAALQATRKAEPVLIEIDWEHSSSIAMLHRLRIGAEDACLSAVLNGICLNYEDLRGIFLVEACLVGSSFTDTNFHAAFFSEVDFSYSEMSRVHLGFTVFFDVNFSHSNMTGATMHGAQLEDANFCGANLSDADLEEVRFDLADMTGCILDRSKVRGADFSKALNLTTDQISSAFGVKEGPNKTLLPEGLDYPDFWYVGATDETTQNGDLDTRVGKEYHAFRTAYEKWLASFSNVLKS
jgi:hypothetical protein